MFLNHYVILLLVTDSFIVNPANKDLLGVCICPVLHWVLELGMKVNDPERGLEVGVQKVSQFNVISTEGGM